jgi:peptidoglycan/xylan/chitin deacetylase (PgdA/CDA1 family)
MDGSEMHETTLANDDADGNPEPVWPQRVVVLMYHGLHDDPSERYFDPRYSVSPQAFEAQMRAIRERRARAWLPGDPPGLRGLPHPQVMVTFDDGDASDAEVALPRLVALGLHAAFFVTSEFVGRRDRLSPAQLRRLADAGMMIGSHGATHAFLSTLSDADLREELVRSREQLQDWCGRRVDTLALPGGRGGPRVLQAAREAGYRTVYGSEPGNNAGRNAGAAVQRVAVTRGVDAAAFAQLIAWRGRAAQLIRWRHRLLQWPKQLVGDRRYDRLREAIVR